MNATRFQTILARFPEVRDALGQLIREQPEPVVRRAIGLPTIEIERFSPITSAELAAARAIGWDD